MARVVKCPKCGKLGSLQPKKTKHGVYWRVGHYLGLKGKTRKIKWCYIGKEIPEVVKKQLITQNEIMITQEFTQTNTESNNLKLSSIQQKNPETETSIFSQKFNAYKNFFGHTNSHDSPHNPLFSININETFMNPQLPLIPCGSSLTAWSFSNRHT